MKSRPAGSPNSSAISTRTTQGPRSVGFGTNVCIALPERIQVTPTGCTLTNTVGLTCTASATARPRASNRWTVTSIMSSGQCACLGAISTSARKVRGSGLAQAHDSAFATRQAHRVRSRHEMCGRAVARFESGRTQELHAAVLPEQDRAALVACTFGQLRTDHAQRSGDAVRAEDAGIVDRARGQLILAGLQAGDACGRALRVDVAHELIALVAATPDAELIALRVLDGTQVSARAR